MSFAREASFRVRTAERYTCLKGHLNSQTQLAMRQASAKAPYAALAQLVEHRIRNAGVTSSSLVGGTSLSVGNSSESLRLRPSWRISFDAGEVAYFDAELL